MNRNDLNEKDREMYDHMKELNSTPITHKIGSFVIWGLMIYFVIWIFK
jgi:hypothetical protein